MDFRIRSESLCIGRGFPIVFLQYTSLAINNNIENVQGSCNTIILAEQFRDIFNDLFYYLDRKYLSNWRHIVIHKSID